MRTCQARRYSDQMHCGRCGLTWDINDPEPPTCATEGQHRASGPLRGSFDERISIQKIRDLLNDPPSAKKYEPAPDPFAKVREKMRLKCRAQFPQVPANVLDSIIFQTINEVKGL
jgi:hypothetical protein